MPKKFRLLSIVLAASLLWSCGRISDLTYEKAAEFDGIAFPFANSSGTVSSDSVDPSSNAVSDPASGTVSAASDGYYYEHLTTAQQQNYDLLLEGFLNFSDEITGMSEDSKIVFSAVSAIYLDHPELTWIQNGGGQLMHGTGIGTYIPEYKLDASDGLSTAAQAKAAADSFLSAVDENASDYEKVVFVFDYLVETVDYSEADENCRDIYGALVEQEAVCAGYAAAAKYLLDCLEIPCIIVTGDMLDDGQPHAWNIVWLDDEPYHMDVTWGDPSFSEGSSIPANYRNYSYLLMTTEEVLLERTIDEDICSMPLCTSDLDYFARENLIIEEYPGTLGDILVDAYTEGDSWVTVSFGKDADMNDVLYRLFECYDFYDFFDAAGINVSSSSYSVEESARTLSVFFQN